MLSESVTGFDRILNDYKSSVQSMKMTRHFCNLRQVSYVESLGPSLADICNASTFILFMTSFDSAIVNNDAISGACNRVKPIEEPNKEYDFVIVGGGAGGSVAAARLSENPNWGVLLLEAGPEEPVGPQIPPFTGQFLETKLDWNYSTTNEKHACLSTNGKCKNRAGKNLGGNTMHNGMAYLRGNPTDYNNWAAMGNQGWTWADVKEFFLKSEDNGDIDILGTEHHATGGPLHVERFSYIHPFVDTIIAAAKEAGYPISEDLNGDDIVGYAKLQGTVWNGVRQSTATAFLRPARNRRNLDVSLKSLVTRVIIENNRAVGVEYLKDGELKTVKVKREVIIAGGAVGSPHILLNSGIGPRRHLESVGVKVVKDLPGVGENFHNHATFRLNFAINEPDVYENNWDVATQYVKDQTGPLSGRGLCVTANLASSATAPDFPDIQIYHLRLAPTCAPGEVGALRSNGTRTITITAAYTHVKSKGRITLASNDPMEYPVIFGNFFSDSNDIDRVIEAIQIILNVANTNVMKAHNFTLLTTPIEACSDFEFLTPEYWACAIPQTGIPDNHQAGTCKMGISSDPFAVVDHRLRVYGLKGLRVADASIMPQVTSTNTAAPTMMIGERVAAFIKKDHRHRHCQ